ncbi:MAG: NAD(P)-dependent alcohol dehydrogenase [Candidatus Sumerlaeia bacterium]|nr:NAD(P)-dependent alcohol dehydrogenase [Candidatus Sumerlaeia bacterium]
MRGYTVAGNGLDTLRVVDLPDPPAPAAGEAVVRALAVTLNYRDLMVAEGRYGQPLKAPMIPCSDACGVVEAVGPGVRGLAPGDRVVNTAIRNWPCGALRREHQRAFSGGGGVGGVLAERFAYPADALVKAPAHLSDEEAAALPVAGLTAWAALVPFAGARAGDWVLSHGTGGVSIFAAQLGARMGLRVVLSTSSESKGKLVRERFGVAATVDYRDPEWPAAVRALTGGEGVDVLLETAGGATFARSIEAMAFGGRIAVIGVLDGDEGPASLVRILARQLRVGGIYMESTAELRAFARAVEAWRLHPCIDSVFSFAEAPAAYRHLAAGSHLGKVAIRVAER